MDGNARARARRGRVGKLALRWAWRALGAPGMMGIAWGALFAHGAAQTLEPGRAAEAITVPEVPDEPTSASPPILQLRGTAQAGAYAGQGAFANENDARWQLRRAFVNYQFEQVLALCDRIDEQFPENTFTDLFRSMARTHLEELRRAEAAGSPFSRVLLERMRRPVVDTPATRALAGTVTVAALRPVRDTRAPFPTRPRSATMPPWTAYVAAAAVAAAMVAGGLLLARRRPAPVAVAAAEPPSAPAASEPAGPPSPPSTMDDLFGTPPPEPPAAAASPSTATLEEPSAAPPSRPRRRREPLPQEVQEDFDGEVVLDEDVFVPPSGATPSTEPAEATTPRFEPVITFEEGPPETVGDREGATQAVPLPGHSDYESALADTPPVEVPTAPPSATPARSAGDDLVQALLRDLTERTESTALREPVAETPVEPIRLETLMAPETPQAEAEPDRGPEAAASATPVSDTQDLLAYARDDQRAVEEAEPTPEPAPPAPAVEPRPKIRHPAEDELEWTASLAADTETERFADAEVDPSAKTQSSCGSEAEGLAAERTEGLSTEERQRLLEAAFDLPATPEPALELHVDQTAAIDLDVEPLRPSTSPDVEPASLDADTAVAETFESTEPAMSSSPPLPAVEQTPGGGLPQSLFEREWRMGREAARAGNWEGAVHHLSIAAALRPDLREVKDELREARRRRKTT